MRLIDADVLKKNFCATECARTTCKDCSIEYYIEHFASPVDAEPVVRCKDCKWYEESKHSELRPNRFCYRLRNDNGVPVGYNWDSDDFCSYGERREYETN